MANEDSLKYRIVMVVLRLVRGLESWLIGHQSPIAEEAEKLRKEISKNRQVYDSLLPKLLRDHKGEYVVIVKCQVVCISADRKEAMNEAIRKYPNARLSCYEIA